MNYAGGLMYDVEESIKKEIAEQDTFNKITGAFMFLVVYIFAVVIIWCSAPN